MFFLDEAWESTYLRESRGGAPRAEGCCEFALWGWCIGGRPVVLPVLGVLSDSGGGGLPLLFDLADGSLSILGFFWFPFYFPAGALFIMWIGRGGTKDWPLLAGERTLVDTALGLVYCSISRQAFSAILSFFESFSLFSFYVRLVPSRDFIGRLEAEEVLWLCILLFALLADLRHSDSISYSTVVIVPICYTFSFSLVFLNSWTLFSISSRFE